MKKPVGIIDIGSNSVRLMMSSDGKTLYKEIDTTRLGEGTAKERTLLPAAIDRTVRAVAAFVKKARGEGAEEVYAYATEAVRSASNRDVFTDAVKAACGLEVDVLSGEDEAVLGAKGALMGGSGAVIDVGGASAEVSVITDGNIHFAKSFPIGTVRIFDLAGRDFDMIDAAIRYALDGEDIPNVPEGLPVYGIGGTSTSLAAVSLALERYDPEKVNGHRMTCAELRGFAKMASGLSVEEVKAIKGMDVRRADVIGGGAQLLSYLVKRLGSDAVSASEADNQEGYLFDRVPRQSV
ncbi:MAG: hypothetical protein LUD47_01015 [Clostridia bacterium]|nr:hypothetical protein [Clostridia bacterium]